MDLHPSLAKPEVREAMDKAPPHEASLDGFLAHGAIVRDDSTVTVKELIKHYANREGGVHYDGTPATPLIEDIRVESEEALRLTVLSVGRVAYRGLEPLASAVMLSGRPGPFGLQEAWQVPKGRPSRVTSE
jgi:hypothetical protein